MNPFASYKAIDSKLHAKKGKGLRKEEWQKLAQLEEVSQVIQFLKRKPLYKTQFMKYESQDELHRHDLEVILDRYVASEIENVVHFFSGSYKAFIKTFLMEYEIEDLMLIIRTISQDETLVGIEKRLIHSERWHYANYNKLLQCKDMSTFIETLRKTPYYNVLRSLTKEDNEKREFHVEMKLYELFYNQLMEATRKLKAKDEEIAKEMIGFKIDQINAQWIYRGLRYYDISPEEILIYCLKGGQKLSYRHLKTLCYMKDMNAFKKQIGNYLKQDLFKEEDIFIECTMNRYLSTYADRKDKRKESIATSLAYIMKLNIEVNDLTTLTECIRYKVSKGELSRYLVHTI